MKLKALVRFPSACAIVLSIAICSLLATASSSSAKTSPTPSTSGTIAPSPIRKDIEANRTGPSISVVSGTGALPELRLRPGQSQTVNLRLTTQQSSLMAMVTYAANLTSGVNGGMNIGKLDEPQTGATKWVDYPTQRWGLSKQFVYTKKAIVTVPKNAKPGEYSVGIATQEEPIKAEENKKTGLRVVSRQAIPILITVPGPLEPAMNFNDVNYTNTIATTTLAVNATNSGNQILQKPKYTLVLKDSDKNELQRHDVPMKALFQGPVLLRVILQNSLDPGQYYIDIDMSVEGIAQHFTATDLPLTVGEGDNAPAPPTPWWVWALAALLLLILLLLLLIWLRKRRAAALARIDGKPVPVAEVLTLLGSRVTGVRGNTSGTVQVYPIDAANSALSEVGLDSTNPADASATAGSTPPTGSGTATSTPLPTNALVALADGVNLASVAEPAALVTRVTLDQANAQGANYQGPALLIGVDSPQDALELLSKRYF